MGSSEKVALVTGCGGLVGSETTTLLIEQGFNVVGIDNNMRQTFFGINGSVRSKIAELLEKYPKQIDFWSIGVQEKWKIDLAVSAHKYDLIVHAAAQPSHDWAARQPHTDFAVNALGTLNVVDAARRYCPETPFCHVSTSKVYGDTPNRLPLQEEATRYTPTGREGLEGIGTDMSIDHSLHSLFGVSKASGDLIVQEYGRYFGMPTLILRPGCVTGAAHAGVELHGFLSYLMKCAISGKQYKIYGYKGKQVRCNIYARDLARCFLSFYNDPKLGANVYNIGGGMASSISMVEAIKACEEITGKTMDIDYVAEPRIGDHIWWVSNIEEFKRDFGWNPTVTDPKEMLEDIYEAHNAV